jgi:hypothetical protein
MQSTNKVTESVLKKEQSDTINIINSEELNNIINELSMGYPDKVSSDIRVILKETDFVHLLSFFKKEKETNDNLSIPDKHKIGDGSSDNLVKKLREAKTDNDIEVLFISSSHGSPKDQSTQTVYTDLFIAYLNTLLLR